MSHGVEAGRSLARCVGPGEELVCADFVMKLGALCIHKESHVA